MTTPAQAIADTVRWMERAARSARLRGSRREAALNAALAAAISGDHAAARGAQAELCAMGMAWYADRPIAAD